MGRPVSRPTKPGFAQQMSISLSGEVIAALDAQILVENSKIGARWTRSDVVRFGVLRWLADHGAYPPQHAPPKEKRPRARPKKRTR